MENKKKNFKDILIKRIDSRESKIGIVGLGYVGLPLSLCFAKAGYKVVGIDIDKTKVDLVNKGFSYINHIEATIVSEYRKKGLLEATTDFSIVTELDAVILCLPTPLNSYKEPDLSYIIDTMNTLKDFLHNGQIVSLESTSYPGTTEEIIKPIIEDKGLEVGQEFFIVYSPEREDPVNKNYSTFNIPKVLGGITNECKDVGKALYNQAIKTVIPVSSTKVAEMTKLLENIHRAVNIGLINELKILTDQMNIDLYEVIKAASTKPFGFVPYYPGPGLGGHCIPIDPFYLTWKAKEFGMHTRFIELAGEINSLMPEYVVNKTTSALNGFSKSVKGSKILVLGLAYKKNIDDMRESPSVEIIDMLNKKGAKVYYDDPYFSVFPKIRKNIIIPEKIIISEKNLKQFDVVIIATDHDSFDYEMIKKYSKVIVDTRGRFSIDKDIIRA